MLQPARPAICAIILSTLAAASSAAIQPPLQLDAPGSAPMVIAQEAEARSGIRFEKLENGLRICVIEDPGAPELTLQLWFRAGSMHDSPGRPGLTHIALHALNNRADSIAGPIPRSARTFEDASCLSVVLSGDASGAQPLARLQSGLSIVRAWLRPAAIDPVEVGPARDGASAASVETESFRLLRGALYSDHPYQHPPQFIAAASADIDAAALNEHVERWFSPTYATLFISGDASLDAAHDAARRELSAIPWRDGPRRADFDTPPDVQINLLPLDSTVSDRMADVLIAWRSPMFDSPDTAAINVLMHRLCNPIDGPIRRRLADLGYAATWRIDAWRESGMLSLRAVPLGQATATVTDVRRAVEQTLEEAAREPCREVELNRARAQAIRAAALQRVPDRLTRLALHELLGGDILLDEYELPRLRRTTAGDLMLAARFLTETRRVVMKVEPESARKSGGNATKPPPPLSRATPLGLDAIFATSAPGWRREFDRPAARRIERSINPAYDLAYQPVRGLEILQLRLQIRDEQQPTRLSPELRGALLAKIESEQMRDYLSYHGLAISMDDSAIDASGPPERIDSVLELLFTALSAANAGRVPPVRVTIAADLDAAIVESAIRQALPADAPGRP